LEVERRDMMRKMSKIMIGKQVKERARNGEAKRQKV